MMIHQLILWLKPHYHISHFLPRFHVIVSFGVLLGGAVNAAALGRIGIVVAWTSEKLKAFAKLRRYLNFLGIVGKNTLIQQTY